MSRRAPAGIDPRSLRAIPSVVLFGSSRADAAIVARTLPESVIRHAESATDWPVRWAATDVAVVFSPLSASVELEVWRRFAVRMGAVVVFVSPLSPEAVRSREEVQAWASVVWHEEVEDQLVEAIEDARDRCSDHRWSRPIARAASHPLASKWFAELLMHDRPPTSVAGWAARCGASTSSLRYHIRACLGPVSLKELVDWRLMHDQLRAGAPGTSRDGRHSRSIGVHPRTLDRLARRLVGVPVRRLRRDPSEGWAAFERWIDAHWPRP